MIPIGFDDEEYLIKNYFPQKIIVNDEDSLFKKFPMIKFGVAILMLACWILIITSLCIEGNSDIWDSLNILMITIDLIVSAIIVILLATINGNISEFRYFIDLLHLFPNDISEDDSKSIGQSLHKYGLYGKILISSFLIAFLACFPYPLILKTNPDFVEKSNITSVIMLSVSLTVYYFCFVNRMLSLCYYVFKNLDECLTDDKPKIKIENGTYSIRNITHEDKESKIKKILDKYETMKIVTLFIQTSLIITIFCFLLTTVCSLYLIFALQRMNMLSLIITTSSIFPFAFLLILAVVFNIHILAFEEKMEINLKLLIIIPLRYDHDEKEYSGLVIDYSYLWTLVTSIVTILSKYIYTS